MKPWLSITLMVTNASFANGPYLSSGFVYRNVCVVDTTVSGLNVLKDNTFQHVSLPPVPRIDMLMSDTNSPSKYKPYSSDHYLAYRDEVQKKHELTLCDRAPTDSEQTTRQFSQPGGGQWHIVTTSLDTIANCRLDSLSGFDLCISTDARSFVLPVKRIALLHRDRDTWINRLLGTVCGSITGFGIGALVGAKWRIGGPFGSSGDMWIFPALIGSLLFAIMGNEITGMIMVETYDFRGESVTERINTIQRILR